jgi:hypothetical protein
MITLIKRTSVFEWIEEYRSTLQFICESLAKDPIMKHPD